MSSMKTFLRFKQNGKTGSNRNHIFYFKYSYSFPIIRYKARVSRGSPGETPWAELQGILIWCPLLEILPKTSKLCSIVQYQWERQWKLRHRLKKSQLPPRKPGYRVPWHIPLLPLVWPACTWYLFRGETHVFRGSRMKETGGVETNKLVYRGQCTKQPNLFKIIYL